ncbi:16S rRNA (guanine(966)-N(2))-methyltransferase RsmD [Lentisphaera profundi]|uniref:16S rRNA (Guanine(966)-N(2))-methyltransferase RsmD n=1 Tax=Lentisphaera profundi TaxID=1658616 RepID=A0ABY7VUW5_9BACT|nr:16S rRNA (guanine(966)-N(2))-methyltransferase RsmD [Lentisphaera profundi]WDE97862.1 16S rRNA (guanine(966)-N(2))-methyltransferase RsmD [Lentisphaera profundi]
MRIIGGAARGIRLEAGDNPATRPTTDRLKETLFNMIGCLQGDVVVDVFAGSGALGLEALSRGAKKVYFIENDRHTMRVIENNYEKVKKSMRAECGEVVFLNSDWRQALMNISNEVDVFISDPPYGEDSELAKELIESEQLVKAGHGESFLVIEHLTISQLISDRWKQVKVKHCRPTSFSFFTRVDSRG